jgi:hypothetical protein
MQIFTFEQANKAIQIHTENATSVSGANSKKNKLRDKHHNDVDIVSWRMSVPKGANVNAAGKLRAPTVVVLNYTMSQVNIMAEHSFYYPSAAKNKYRFESCLDYARAKLPETSCPICKAAQQNLHNAAMPYMRLGITVLKEVINDQGQTVGWDKKFLVAKNDNLKVFNNILVTGERANNGSIRGMAFRLERENTEKSLASGKPALNDDNSFAFSFVGEEWLAQVQNTYQPDEVKSDDGKYIYKPKNWLTTPIDVNSDLDILGYADEEELRKEFDPSYVHKLQPQAVTPVVAAPAIAPPSIAAPGLPATPIAGVAPAIPATTIQTPPTVAPIEPTVNKTVETLPEVSEINNTASIPPVPTPAVPVVPVAPIPPTEAPALVAQRNLTPVIPPIGVGNAEVDPDEVPWE